MEREARMLLADCGCVLVDNGPRPGSDGFCSALLDEPTANHHDNLVYLAPMREAQWALEMELRRICTNSDSGRRYLDSLSELGPEAASHVGFKYSALEDLEAALDAISCHSRPGALLHGYVEVTKFRPRPGLDPEVDARMAASPAFSGTEPPSFANHLVQCFVRTSLFGVLTSASTIELDFAFPPFFERVPTY